MSQFYLFVDKENKAGDFVCNTGDSIKMTAENDWFVVYTFNQILETLSNIDKNEDAKFWCGTCAPPSIGFNSVGSSKKVVTKYDYSGLLYEKELLKNTPTTKTLFIGENNKNIDTNSAYEVSLYIAIDNDINYFTKEIVIGNKISFVTDKRYCIDIVKASPKKLKDVPKKLHTKELCQSAITNKPEVLKDCREDLVTYSMCMSAVKCNGSLLKDIPKRHLDENLCLTALEKSNGLILEAIPQELQTEKIISIAYRLSLLNAFNNVNRHVNKLIYPLDNVDELFDVYENYNENLTHKKRI